MGWRYRSPKTFPAWLPNGLREAAAYLNTDRVLGTYSSEGPAQTDAELFRKYRWCLRQDPDVDRALSTLEATYDYRTKVTFSSGIWFLTLSAKPTKLSELLTLNPHLSSDLISASQ